MKIERLDTGRSQLKSARAIANVLLPTEDTIDRSIVAGSQLLLLIAQARIDNGLSAHICHEAMRSASEGISALVGARDMMVRCHAELTAVRDQLGLEGSDVGCTYNSLSANEAPAMRAA